MQHQQYREATRIPAQHPLVVPRHLTFSVTVMVARLKVKARAALLQPHRAAARGDERLVVNRCFFGSVIVVL
jgi:hypothetical protein